MNYICRGQFSNRPLQIEFIQHTLPSLDTEPDWPPPPRPARTHPPSRAGTRDLQPMSGRTARHTNAGELGWPGRGGRQRAAGGGRPPEPRVAGPARRFCTALLAIFNTCPSLSRKRFLQWRPQHTVAGCGFSTNLIQNPIWEIELIIASNR